MHTTTTPAPVYNPHLQGWLMAGLTRQQAAHMLGALQANLTRHGVITPQAWAESLNTAARRQDS